MYNRESKISKDSSENLIKLFSQGINSRALKSLPMRNRKPENERET